MIVLISKESPARLQAIFDFSCLIKWLIKLIQFAAPIVSMKINIIDKFYFRGLFCILRHCQKMLISTIHIVSTFTAANSIAVTPVTTITTTIR